MRCRGEVACRNAIHIQPKIFIELLRGPPRWPVDEYWTKSGHNDYFSALILLAPCRPLGLLPLTGRDFFFSRIASRSSSRSSLRLKRVLGISRIHSTSFWMMISIHAMRLMVVATRKKE